MYYRACDWRPDAVSLHLDPETLRAHKRRNAIHSLLLLIGLGVVVAGASYLLWGAIGVAAAGIALTAAYVLTPQVPPDAVMRLYRAERLTPEHGGPLWRIMAELAARAELPATPNLYVVPSGTLNAFATGTPGHAAIALTEGLLRRLTMREIAAVLAHETSHIRNNDLRVMGLADILTRFAQSLSYAAVALAVVNLMALANGDRTMPWLPLALLYLAPALSSLMQLGLSRTRELDADHEAAMLTGDPVGLASALRRLDHYTGQFWEDLMMPVPARRVPQPSLLRTHPPTEERVSRLLALASDPMEPPLTITDEPMVSMVGWGPGTMRPRYRFPGVWY